MQARLREGVDRETALSQAGIDAKARELLGALGASAAGLGAASPGSLKLGGASSAAGSIPLRPSSAPQRGAPPPAVVAATEAIAALRLKLPPSPAKLQGLSPERRPATKIAVLSGSAGGIGSSAKPGSALPASQPRPSAFSVRFAPPPPSGAPSPQRRLQGQAAEAGEGEEPHTTALLQHSSSSELEDDSYLLEGEESSESNLAACR